MSPLLRRVSRLVDDQRWGQREEERQQTPGREVWRTRLSGRTVRGTPGLHGCIPLPAERLLGAHPQGPSRDGVHTCACALGVSGRVPGACTLLKRGSPSCTPTSPLPPPHFLGPQIRISEEPLLWDVGHLPFFILRIKLNGTSVPTDYYLRKNP